MDLNNCHAWIMEVNNTSRKTMRQNVHMRDLPTQWQQLRRDFNSGLEKVIER